MPTPSWREADHDDVVLALALAVWYRDREYHNFDALVARRNGYRRQAS